MQQLLIACGDVDLLRQIVRELPEGRFKPLATKSGAGIAQKLRGRRLPLAIVYETLADGPADSLLRGLRQLDPAPRVLFLSRDVPPTSDLFDRSLRYPVPGPVLRHALKALAPEPPDEQDLQKWRLFYRELNALASSLDDKSYFEILGVPPDVPHHRLQKAYDLLSQRYHPDRYDKYRSEKWGRAVHDLATQLYRSITEAYGVLRDRKLRARYTNQLASGELRLDTRADSERGPQSLEALGNTTTARKFLKLAQSDLAAGRLTSALQNLQFAHSMEPDNAQLLDKINELKKRAR